MIRSLLLLLLLFFTSYSLTKKELEQWIDDVDAYQQVELFYDEKAEPYSSAYYTTKIPSEEFKQYSRLAAEESSELEQLLRERYSKGKTPSAVKLYIAFGKPSLDFILTFWKKAPERSANFERDVVDVSLTFHHELLRPHLENLFSKFPNSERECSFRHGIVYSMLSENLDTAAVRYAIKTAPILLHSVRDSIILPILIDAIPGITNSAQRTDLMRAMVKQLEMYPDYYDLVAQSPLANPQDVKEILRYGFEYYKRKGLSDAVVKLALNYGDFNDRVHLYKADSLFIHLCRYYNPAEFNEREKAQLEVLYRTGRGYGIGNYTYKPEVLKAWQEWICSVSPDSPKMRLKLLKHMRSLKLSASDIYEQMKTSGNMRDNEAIIDTLLYGKSDTPFLNAVLKDAHLLSDSLYYRIFSRTTEEKNIDSCGEGIIAVLPKLSTKNKIRYLYMIIKVGEHKELWDSTIRETFLSATMKREKVPLNRFLYYYYLFCRSDMGEKELLQLLNLFRSIPNNGEYAYCKEALYATLIDAIDKKYRQAELSNFYESVLSKCHKKVASRNDLREIGTKIRNFEPFFFSW